MIRINYDIPKINVQGQLVWAADEDFTELLNLNTEFHIGEMRAVDIVQMKRLSTQSQILLSAVAGALIQHLINNKVDLQEAFNAGFFYIRYVDDTRTRYPMAPVCIKNQKEEE